MKDILLQIEELRQEIIGLLGPTVLGISINERFSVLVKNLKPILKEHMKWIPIDNQP